MRGADLFRTRSRLSNWKALGDRVASASSACGVLWQEHYEPYGEKLNGVKEKVGFAGHAWDSESDLTYMKARFYDAEVGRFLSDDPQVFTGSPASFNRYSYGNDNPYLYVDSSGEMTGTHLNPSADGVDGPGYVVSLNARNSQGKSPGTSVRSGGQTQTQTQTQQSADAHPTNDRSVDFGKELAGWGKHESISDSMIEQSSHLEKDIGAVIGATTLAGATVPAAAANPEMALSIYVLYRPRSTGGWRPCSQGGCRRGLGGSRRCGGTRADAARRSLQSRSAGAASMSS